MSVNLGKMGWTKGLFFLNYRNKKALVSLQLLAPYCMQVLTLTSLTWTMDYPKVPVNYIAEYLHIMMIQSFAFFLHGLPQNQ